MADVLFAESDTSVRYAPDAVAPAFVSIRPDGTYDVYAGWPDLEQPTLALNADTPQQAVAELLPSSTTDTPRGRPRRGL